jgi:hypothetical protein
MAEGSRTSGPAGADQRAAAPLRVRADHERRTAFLLTVAHGGDEARLEREEREWERPRQARRQVVANLAAEWDRPDLTLEQKQAAIAQTLIAIVLNSGGKGVRFHHSQSTPVFREEG